MDKIRVLVADDHPIVRKGFVHILNCQDDIEVVGEADDGRMALELAESLRPQVLLTDLSMPRMSGLEAAQILRQRRPEIAVVVCSMHQKEEYLHRLLAVGILGYVLKSACFSDLLQAIRLASRGDPFLSPPITAQLIASYLRDHSENGKGAAREYAALSEREKQVFRLLVEGKATGAIAEQLFISPKTVEKHRTNIMKKLDIPDLVGMVKYALRIGVIDPDFWKN